MKKNNVKKGFTLVELLVVIAILAILATVSVVGYLGFTNKAKESKVMTEATQIRDVINGELLDGKVHQVGAYYAQLANGKLYLDDDADVTDQEEDTTKPNCTDAIKAFFSDIKDLEGTYELNDGILVYISTAKDNNYKATINFSDGSVQTAKQE